MWGLAGITDNSIVMEINLKIIGLVAVQSVLKPFAEEVSKDHCKMTLVLKEQWWKLCYPAPSIGNELSQPIHPQLSYTGNPTLLLPPHTTNVSG